jgi:hypothetical protein
VTKRISNNMASWEQHFFSIVWQRFPGSAPRPIRCQRISRLWLGIAHLLPDFALSRHLILALSVASLHANPSRLRFRAKPEKCRRSQRGLKAEGSKERSGGEVGESATKRAFRYRFLCVLILFSSNALAS